MKGAVLRGGPCLFAANWFARVRSLVRAQICHMIGKTDGPTKEDQMSNIVLLDNVEHHDLKVRGDRGEAFGDHVNQTLIFPNEFRDIQRDYPILFRKDPAGAYQAVALLGLERDKNLFLDGTKWAAHYIPAVLARGPFSIVLQRPNGQTGDALDAKIQIDLDNAAVNTEDGFPLFLPQGGYAPYLEHMIGVLRTLHDGVALAQGFFKALHDLDLIEPVALEIKTSETEQFSVPDVYSINQEKFHNLPAATLEALHQSGVLAACYWVLGSLDNIQRLIDRKNRG